MRRVNSIGRIFSFLLTFVLMSISGVYADQQQDANHGIVAAAQKGNLTKLIYWLDHGANVDAKDADGNTALLVALLNDKVECALHLIDRGANVNARDVRPNSLGWSVLSAALNRTSVPHKVYKNLIVTLLDKGADVNFKYDYGTSLLDAAEVACMTQGSDIFRLLLAHGADITTRTEDGSTVLMEVLGHSGTKPETEMDMVKALIEKGANLLETDKHGDTSLAMAACGSAPEIVKFLVEHGDDINRVDEYGLTPLLWACGRQASLSVVKTLLDYGADVKTKDKEGQSALAMASEKGYTEEVRLLLDRGAEVDVRDKHRVTPLMRAVNHINIDTARILVAHGAAVNGVDEDGNTPLVWAMGGFTQAEDGGTADFLPKAKFDLLPLLKFLVQHGAKLNAKNKHGMTVLSLARRTNPKAAAWLKQHGAKP